ncbi:MAG: pyridoxal phosphate-dependent aminotransferase [Ruminococcaceae bacterium]|nr:pyridoxal phosphate-dependent aminotransferase [Oscillospiraceae bacterium]
MLNNTMYELGAMRSCIRELFEYGLRQAKAVGKENVFDYSLGNPSIPAPALVNESIRDIVENENTLQVHGYTSAAGYDGVRKAVADDLNARFQAGVRPENLFFTCGAAPALVSVLKALITGPEAEILTVAPFFPEYRPFTEANGGKFTVVPPDMEHFQINFEALEAAVNANTQGVIINSPNNPSGVVYTRETLERLAAILRAKGEEFGHPVYLIADEPYRELVYGGVQAPWVPAIYENTVVCYSWSKSLSLPGERIGYVLVPDACADAEALYCAVAGAARICGHVCPPSLLQRVVARCVTQMPDLAAYDENRTLLYRELSRMGYHMAKPDGAFYLFIQAPDGDSEAFSEKAKQKNLLVVPGTSFGCREYFRICYCVSNDMIRRSLPVFEELINGK